MAADPAGWLAVGGHVLAHGRDPNFPPWGDVVQLNAFAPALRAAAADTLASIAAQCDGIRCDMAMLLTSQVFARTWGGHAGPAPGQEFWPEVLGRLRGQHPDTVLIAEAYWDMERLLQQQGFDFCYDKRLYDRLVGADAPGVRDQLRAGLGFQSRLLRFLENHDEPRIASLLPTAAQQAAAVAVATLPGATLWHEGQFEGRRVRLPVQLARRPSEPLDARLAGWYRSLLAEVAGRQVRAGGWRLLAGGGLAGQSVLPQPARLGLGRRPGRRPAPGGGQPVRAARPGPAAAGLARPARPALGAGQPARRGGVPAGRRRAGPPRAVRRPGAVAVPPARGALSGLPPVTACRPRSPRPARR